MPVVFVLAILGSFVGSVWWIVDEDKKYTGFHTAICTIQSAVKCNSNGATCIQLTLATNICNKTVTTVAFEHNNWNTAGDFPVGSQIQCYAVGEPQCRIMSSHDYSTRLAAPAIMLCISSTVLFMLIIVVIIACIKTSRKRSDYVSL